MRDAVSFPGSGPLVTIPRSMSLYYRVGARMHCPQYGRSTVGFVQVPLVPVDPGLAIGNFKFFALVWRILLAPTGVFIGLFSMVPAAAVIPIRIAARFSKFKL